MGRVYLPVEDRERFGVARRPPGGPTTLYGPHQLRGGPGRGVVRAGPDAAAACSTGGPGPAPPPWPASTAGCWSASSATRRACSAGRMSLPGLAEGGGGRPGPGPGDGVTGPRPATVGSVVVVGGGLAGLAAALDCADRGARVDAARAAQPPRRSHLVLPARRPLDRQRPARVPALLHRVPVLPGPDRRRGGRRAAGPPRPPGGGAPAARAGRPRRIGRLRRSDLPAPLHLAGSLLRYPASPAGRSAAAWAGPSWRCADSTSTTRPSTSETLRDLAGPARTVAGRRGRPLGSDHRPDRQPAGRGGVPGHGGQGVPDRPADRHRAPPTSAGAGCRSASCTASGRRRPGAGRRRGPPERAASERSSRRSTRGRSRLTGSRFTVTDRRRTGSTPTRSSCAVPHDAAGASCRPGRSTAPGPAGGARHLGRHRRASGLRSAGDAVAAAGRAWARRSSGCSTAPRRPGSAGDAGPAAVPGGVDLGRGRPARPPPRRPGRLGGRRAGPRSCPAPDGPAGRLPGHQGARTPPSGPDPAPPACDPDPATAWPGLAVAGAWTDTGWPATMEGAVRSGRAAAASGLPGAVALRPRRTGPRRSPISTANRHRGGGVTPTIGVPEVLARSRRAISPGHERGHRTPGARDPAARHATTWAGPTPTATRSSSPGGKGIRPTLAILSRRGGLGRARGRGARRRWPSSWSTTSRSSTTTSSTPTPNAITARRCGPCTASARPSSPATPCRSWPTRCCSRARPAGARPRRRPWPMPPPP